MTQELVRYALLASASATVAGLVFEGLRRRVAGTGLDRQLREQHPYGSDAQIVEGRSRYVETFVAGAFAAAGTHPLTATHPRTGAELPIGVSVELREQPDGLHGAWHVSDIELGNEVLTLVHDEVPLGLSVGFVEGVNRWNREHTRVQRVTASLDHVAVVRSPAYPGARVMAVRATERSGVPVAPRLTLARLRR